MALLFFDKDLRVSSFISGQDGKKHYHFSITSDTDFATLPLIDVAKLVISLHASLSRHDKEELDRLEKSTQVLLEAIMTAKEKM